MKKESAVDSNVEAVRHAISQYGVDTDSDCRTIVDFYVYLKLDRDNVGEMLKLIAGYERLNLIFWAEINSAPRTAQGWDEVGYICSGGKETSDRIKAIYRHAVDIVRDWLGSAQVRRRGLFSGSQRR